MRTWWFCRQANRHYVVLERRHRILHGHHCNVKVSGGVPVPRVDRKSRNRRLKRPVIVEFVVKPRVAHPGAVPVAVEAVRGRQHVPVGDERAAAQVAPTVLDAPAVRGHPWPGAQRVGRVLVDGASHPQAVFGPRPTAHIRHCG